ncbi:MAG: NAD(P)-dependent alcohol dehydrogenase, partial [Mycobacteriaceae bacterium]|nr:NAD(P)-dependent alcohol dehydrogenase [Mycobacteriaceae bacterium]
GLLATYAVLEEDSVVHVPEFLTDAEAASLNCAGVTAWHALTRPVRTAAGDQVLVVGSGSVALFGVQFAKALGARVIAVTSSEEKAARLRALGAAEVVDRTVTPDWEAAVLELTGGDGVAQVLDAVGPATLPKSLAAAAYNAQITMVGAFPADSVEPDADPLRGAFASVRRIAVGSRADFEAMNAFLTEHRIRPAVDRVFPVSEAVDAYRYFRDAGPFGKVVIELPS